VHDKLTIETPEQIPLEFPLAGIGSRFLAAAVDSLVQLVISLAMLVAGMLLFAGLFALSSDAGLWVMGIFILLLFLLQFGYYAILEALWNGQTLGKRYMHLRVIKDSGRPITAYEAVARNLMRIIDSIPGYGVGIISMLLSAKNQRLGDYVAGTVVVHEKPLAPEAKVSWKPAQTDVPAGYDVGKLTPEEFQLIETFLLRREQLATDVRHKMARQIANRIAEKLNLTAEDRLPSEPLLEKLANEYRSRAQYR
jgi:uncharacterized RDD family membrane protein YckC